MKNYWLDKKDEKEFNKNLDACCEKIVGEFQDSTIIVGNYNKDDFTITVGAEIPGGDCLQIHDVQSKSGESCSVCGQEMWPWNDEHTLMQGDPMCACYEDSCNLDIFYPDRFIQNETLQVLDKSKHGVTVFQTMFTPVVAGSMTGTINWAYGGFNYASFSFNVDVNGKFDIKRLGSDGKPVPTLEEELASGILSKYYDEIYSWESSLNCQTGVLEVHWHSSEPPTEIIISYEYNREI